jgi:hypothetical protein
VLLFGFIQQDIHDMPVAFTWFMIYLSFPLGFLGIGFDYFAIEPIAKAFGLAYDPFFSLLPSWIAMTIIGYLQWFKLVPKALAMLVRAVTKSAA